MMPDPRDLMSDEPVTPLNCLAAAAAAAVISFGLWQLTTWVDGLFGAQAPSGSSLIQPLISSHLCNVVHHIGP